MNRYIFLLISSCFIVTYSQAQFIEGYYYDKTGQKKSGLIKHKFGARTFSDGPDNCILFKENKKGDKVTLTVDDIKSFVIKSDSFTILKNFSIGTTSYATDFVKVVEAGKINLYYHYTSIPNPKGGASTAITYLISKQGLIKPLFKKDFKRDFQSLFAENKDLVSRIEKRELEFDDMKKIVSEYNQFIASEKRN